MEQIHSRYNRIFAIVVFAISSLVFLLTVAPTVAFWDCGEYIAAGHSVGIPHPPGNPLFMMMLRVSSILFSFLQDTGYRMNLLVVFMSAATGMVIYLIVVRVATSFIGIPDTTWKRLTVYGGGIVGGLFTVFADTFWFSAVEASEANPSMFFIAVATWLAIVWAQSKDPKRDRLLLLLAYVSFLGIGVHMYSMIVLPPIFLFIILWDKEKRSDWRLWVTAIAVGIVIASMPYFIYIAPVMVLLLIVGIYVDKPINQRKWRFSMWLAIFAIVGFSTHIYIPIRSNLEPIINENHPADWNSFRDYLDRKQYGSESMFSRMFWRRGQLTTQFGIDGHMGYGGFHLTQFYRFSQLDTQRSFMKDNFLVGFGKLLIYLIPTLLMLFAWGYLYKRNKKLALFLIVLMILTSVVMVFYMNFADGTRPEKHDYLMWARSGKQGPMPTVHREVRIRDYFFAAAFMYFGMWIGIAATAVMHYLFTSKNSTLRTTLAPIVAVLFIVSPALPITQNWAKHNRNNDWVPYDYAYNLLMSCEKDGIIFTNGDNDTFPLWALQEAYGIRRDVRIVNLSLLNTKWYIKQLKKLEPKVPISYSEKEIDELNHERNPLPKPARYKMPNAGISVVVPGIQQHPALRIQDKMVLNIVDSNNWKKPIYFAVTVSDDNKMGVDPYLQMQGLVYRIKPQIVPQDENMDIGRTVYLLDNVYRFRGLGKGKKYLNETTEKLLSNYAASYIQIALKLRGPLQEMKEEIAKLERGPSELGNGSADSLEGAPQVNLQEKKKAYQDTLDLVLTKLDQCVGIMPWDWRPRVLRHEMLLTHGKHEEAEVKMREALKIEPNNAEYQKMLVQTLERSGKKQEANEILRNLTTNDSDPWSVYASLARNYEELGMYDSAQQVMMQFAESHPGDRRAATLIERYQAMKSQPKQVQTAPLTADSGEKTEKDSAEKVEEDRAPVEVN